MDATSSSTRKPTTNLNNDFVNEDLASLNAILRSRTTAPSPSPTLFSMPGPSSIALTTALEQNFKNLMEASKAAFIKWYPTYQSYQNARGAKSLQQCMDPIVQTAFTYLLPIFQKDRTLFLASTSTELYSAIHKLYRLSTILSYKSLLINIYMAKSEIFSQQLCDIYIQNVLNLLSQYPTLLDKSHGGTSPKKFSEVVVHGIYPLTLRQDILDSGPVDLDEVISSLYNEYDNYAIHNKIIAHTCQPSNKSSEGKVADVAIIQPTQERRCINCKLMHPNFTPCTATCTLCVGIKPHQFRDKKLCNNYLNWIAKKKSDGTFRNNKKQSNNATSDSADLQALTTQISELNSHLKNVSNKRLLIDSGCNTTIIASSDHSDSNILYRDEKESIATANGQLIPIIGQGSILQMPADFVPTFVDSLISVSQVTKLHNSCVIFLKDIAFNICLNPSIITLLNQIKSIAVDNNLLLCTAHLTVDNLYAVDSKNTDNTSSKLLANATYYQTAQLDTVAAVVRYFHESWSHCSMDLMIHIIKNDIFTNIPSTLTEKAIRKYFPVCSACAAGNMTRKSYASESIVHRDLLPGEELIMDIKIIADNKNNSQKKSFNNNLSALTIIDNATNYKWGFPLQNHGTSTTIIEMLNIVRKEIISHNRVLKYIRADDQFVTSEIQTWCDNCTPQIKIFPCIPHEHQQIGKVERFNQTWETHSHQIIISQTTSFGEILGFGI